MQIMSEYGDIVSHGQSEQPITECDECIMNHKCDMKNCQKEES